MARSAMASTEPLSKQHDDTPDEDNMQCGSNEEEPIESNPDKGWILNVSRAQRRKAKVSDTKNQNLTPARLILRPSIHNAKPKPPPLPKDDYKLVIRPKEGLAVAKLSPAQLSEALLQEAKLTWREADLRIRVDETQNILTVSTPHQQAARTLNQIRQLNIGGRIYPINLYGLAPSESAEGAIHDVPNHYTMEQILDDLYLPGYEFLSCRRLGTTGTVVITILGHKVPFYVYYKGVEVRCYLYKKTVPYFSSCNTTGNRSDVCPNPNVRTCELCGLRNPESGHDCKPYCALCKGNHLTASKGCPKRFCEPYILRRKALDRKRGIERKAPAAQSISSRSTSRRRSSNSRSTAPIPTTTTSRSSQSTSRSRSGRRKSSSHPQPENEKVSWAEVLSLTAHGPNSACTKCNQIKAENDRIKAVCSKLEAELQNLKKEFVSLKTSVTQSAETQNHLVAPEKRRKVDENKGHVENSAEIQQLKSDMREEIKQSSEAITKMVGEMIKEQVANLTAEVSVQIRALTQQVTALAATAAKLQ
ncbi:hypothetical protein HPB48_015481 [Haemaphysalis longicornis]|uniref:Uncharacterized protein n=1 Tax=Haemaphysalis longicornis TaxID=44386 RepID=A0A9J6FHV4_HAELO|nr:hypothetical protein HPB48_015481 [Haemaphysalis longicornis]